MSDQEILNFKILRDLLPDKKSLVQLIEAARNSRILTQEELYQLQIFVAFAPDEKLIEVRNSLRLE